MGEEWYGTARMAYSTLAASLWWRSGGEIKRNWVVYVSRVMEKSAALPLASHNSILRALPVDPCSFKSFLVWSDGAAQFKNSYVQYNWRQVSMQFGAPAHFKALGKACSSHVQAAFLLDLLDAEACIQRHFNGVMPGTKSTCCS